jgi:ribonuclease E
MARKMLIDATHPEETRVVVLNGARLEEFDFETSTKKQIKGNIYLAKITRVEPSLQAAFVEYGGNRHGFLAFSEIHPDYYRIPVSDREAIMAEERAAREAEESGHDENGYGGHAGEEPGGDDLNEDYRSHREPDDQPDFYAADFSADANGGAAESGEQPDEAVDRLSDADARAPDHDDAPDHQAQDHAGERERPRGLASAAGAEPAVDYGPIETGLIDTRAGGEQDGVAAEAGAEAADAETIVEAAPGSVVELREEPVPVETVGGDELEEVQARPRHRHYRNYKIQEVIKRRQIILIQVTKEERGNKGAALTTYLSLAGRYCVLMPNAGRGGGVSRKITSLADRRRLKELMEELDVPDGMGIIVRTAGSERSKAEIKRDYEYLLRLWDDIRELTLRSSAPALIYEEGNLIKRAIRDLYSRDMEEIQVEGHDGYRTAKEFMRMLMPSHSARVKLYRDPTVPLLHRFQVDSQIDQIHNPVVQLRSGGYIVINPTEALVSIDVNSGRATRERNIEETATKTNLEAADEIARQLRLRDLAGLVVIDFIDMEDLRNQKAVEGRLKEAMKNDRARIQLGRISAFGLLELSRQRLRSSLIEASTQTCPHCNGTGTIRSTESAALVVLRAIEEEGIRRRSAELLMAVPTPIALYMLNQKRAVLSQIEHKYGFSVGFVQDDTLVPPAFRLDRLRALTPLELSALAVPVLPPLPDEAEEDEEYLEEAESGEASAEFDEAGEARAEGDAGRRKRRRRKRRRGGFDEHAAADGGMAEAADQHDAVEDDEDGGEGAGAEQGEEDGADDAVPAEGVAAESGAAEGGAAEGGGEAAAIERRRRRRGKRGGRRRRQDGEAPAGPIAASPADQPQPYIEDYPSALDYARDGREHLFELDPLEPVNSPAPAAVSAMPAADADAAPAETPVSEGPQSGLVPSEDSVAAAEPTGEATAPAKPKRRRTPRAKADAAPAEASAPSAEEIAAMAGETIADPAMPDLATSAVETPPKRRRARKPPAAEATKDAEMPVADSPAPSPDTAIAAETAEAVPVQASSPMEAAPVADLPPLADAPAEAAPVTPTLPEATEPPRPRRTGWWSKAT